MGNLQDSAKSGQLDLGLSSLIETSASIDIYGPLAALAHSRLGGGGNGATANSAPNRDEPAAVDEYECLAAQRAWSELVLVCEKKLAANSEDWEAKLWWIRGQLCLGSMPGSILAAPLESSSRAIVKLQDIDGQSQIPPGDARLLKLAETTLVETVRALETAREGELAVLFLERAYRLNSAHGGWLGKLVDGELNARDGQLITRRNEALGRYLGKLKELKTELEGAERKDSSASIGRAACSAKAAHQTPRSRSSRRWLAYAAAVCAVLGIVLYKGVPSWKEGVVGQGPGENLLPTAQESTLFEAQLQPGLRAPAVERISNPSLHNLMGILSALDKPKGKSQEKNDGSQTAEVVRAKEVVNTSGPVEPRDLRVLLTSVESAPMDKVKNHNLPFDGPIVRGESRQDRVIADRTVPGVQSDSDARSLVFTITARTGVWAVPSEGAVEIGILGAGDQVRVVERMGRWLKIMSKANREGYILAEKAEIPVPR